MFASCSLSATINKFSPLIDGSRNVKSRRYEKVAAESITECPEREEKRVLFHDTFSYSDRRRSGMDIARDTTCPIRVRLIFMQWWTAQQLKSKNPDARQEAVTKLAGEGSAQAYRAIATLAADPEALVRDRKSTRLNSSHLVISYAVFCLK